MNTKLFKWDFSLPKSNSDILTNFATTANFGKKGGRSKRHRKRNKRKNTMDTRMDMENKVASQSPLGEKGGEAQRRQKDPSKETVIWEKEIVME